MNPAPILAAALIAAAPASYDPANEVDVELILAVDISQSMDRDEQRLQKAGYAAALVSRDFLDAVAAGPLQRVAVTYMEWGGVDEHFIVADWQVIDGIDSASHMAEEILSAPLRQVQRTSIKSALEKSAELMETNQYQGLRRVVDVSGDGPNNQGGAVTEARDKLVSMGVTINGLPLMMESKKNDWQAMINLHHYYEDCVTGGPSSFVIPVRSKEQFPDAIRKKLAMEIAGLQPSVKTIPVADREPIRCNIYD